MSSSDDSTRGEYGKLLEHEYDGIREYDNPLPRWWTVVFIATIIFSILYLIYYHGGGPGQSVIESYEAEMKAVAAEKAKRAAATGKVDEQTLAKLASDSGAMTEARAIFDKNCVACHGMRGGGKIGPNLTDDYQIHGTARVDIYKTIRDGVPAKGMIAWGNVLGPDELQKVAAYVSTLRGTNVAGGKSPQGTKVAPLK